MHPLKQACRLSWQSPDPSTKNAAIITYQRKSLISGSNHFNAAVDPELYNDRAYKIKYIGHAERNAIFAAARAGIATCDRSMYVVWAACVECADAIVASGIRRVHVVGKLYHICPDRWKQPVEDGLGWLKKGNVEIVYHYEELDERLWFDGREVMV